MKTPRWIVLLALLASATSAQVAEKYRGDWLLVNGGVILHVAESGDMSWNVRRLAVQTSNYTYISSEVRWYRPEQLSGKLDLAADGTFTWQAGPPETRPLKGQFSGETLLLESFRDGAPGSLKMLEFRRIPAEEAKKIADYMQGPADITAHLFDQPWPGGAVQRFIARAVLNNLRQVSAAADQFYLEKGTRKATLDQLIGPDKYVTHLRVVDGEDYGKLKISLGAPLIVTTQGGITVRYGP
jgi:hypothetical protein